MKKLFLVPAAVCAAAGAALYVSRPHPQPAPPPDPVAETAAPAREEPPLTDHLPPRAETPPEVGTQAPDTLGVTNPASRSLAATATNPALDAALLTRTVDLLVSPSASYEQKRDAWRQLREAGKLDQAITELERRTASDLRAAEYPATLGQAYLKKCGAIQDVREQGILAMQADKIFDTALSLDPSNWEARFTKAVALSYWPASLNKGDEIIQHFETLIQQQEALAPQPHFAETYSWLGDQYQKAGRADDARSVWQRGAALFPADDKLRTKLASKP